MAILKAGKTKAYENIAVKHEHHPQNMKITKLILAVIASLYFLGLAQAQVDREVSNSISQATIEFPS